MHEGWGGGDTLPWGRFPLPTTDYAHRDEIGEIVSSILEGHSETSNDQALLIPFDHHIKMKACTMVEGWGTLYPGVKCS